MRVVSPVPIILACLPSAASNGCSGELGGPAPQQTQSMPMPMPMASAAPMAAQPAAAEPQIDYTVVDPGGGGSPANASCDPAAPLAVLPGRVWRLSPAAIERSLDAALGYQGASADDFPADGRDEVIGFDTNARLNTATDRHARVLYGHAVQASAEVVSALPSSPHGCMLSGFEANCAQNFVADYGQRLFRRPLEVADSERFVSAFQRFAAQYDPATAVEMALTSMILSPHFLFRTELGSGAPGLVELTQYELASALSYMVIDGPPDAPLLQAAAAGSLNKTTLAEHATRLLQTEGAKQRLENFFSQYVRLSKLEVAGQLSGTERRLLSEEIPSFVSHVLWQQDGGLRELMTAQHTFGDEALADYYEADAPEADGRIELPNAFGLLSRGSVLASLHGPVQRGQWFLNDVLCQPIHVPEGLDTSPGDELDVDDDATEREWYEAFNEQMPPVCTGCHSQFVPYGLAFSNFDEFGRYQDNDGDRPIDASGVWKDGGNEVPYEDAADLVSQVVDSESGQRCFVQRFMSYAQGRSINSDQEACSLIDNTRQFQGGQLKLQDLIVSITQNDSFYYRANIQ